MCKIYKTHLSWFGRDGGGGHRPPGQSWAWVCVSWPEHRQRCWLCHWVMGRTLAIRCHQLRPQRDRARQGLQAKGHLRGHGPGLHHGGMVGAGHPPTRSGRCGTFVSAGSHLNLEKPCPLPCPSALLPPSGTRAASYRPTRAFQPPAGSPAAPPRLFSRGTGV